MGAVLGGINGVMVHRLAVSPIVVTLGALTLYAGMVILITRGRTVAGVPQDSGRWVGVSSSPFRSTS